MKRGTFALILAVLGSPLLAHAELAPGDGSSNPRVTRHPFPKYYAVELAGRPGSVAWAVNDLGVVAGDTPDRDGNPRATVWAYGRKIDLGTLGGPWSQAVALNNRGQVIGQSSTADQHSSPFVWSDGVMRGIPGITDGQVFAINDRGQIVGLSYDNGQIRSFVYDGRTLTFIGDESVQALSINNRGQVTGGIGIGNGQYRAFVWTDGVITTLDGLGGSYDSAIDINDNGDVVGRAFDGTRDHAVLWHGTTIVELGATDFFGGASTLAYSINNRGEIVGQTLGGLDRAFYYRAGNVTDLNAITLRPPFPFNYGLSINNWGAIAGAGIKDGSSGAQPLLWVQL